MQTFPSILGSLLFYGRMIDGTILTAIKNISIVETNTTLTSRKHLNTLLDYLHDNPDAKIAHMKSEMIIKVHSDGSYLSFT